MRDAMTRASAAAPGSTWPVSPTPTAQQAAFAAALLDASRPLPVGLRAWNGSDPGVRFAVHRNNVVVSLVAALADGFPVVHRLVGADFFDAMARAFVAGRPPSSPVLADYGEDFADWLPGFAPARALPYLADMARLERARVRAYHAADATPLSAAEVATRLARPKALPRSRVVLHPSCTVQQSAYAVARLWAAHQAEGELPEVDIDGPAATLVLRDPHDEVLVVALELAAAHLVAELGRGATLADAVEAATAACGDTVPSLNLAATLALLIRHGAIVGWTPPEDPT